MCKLSDAIDAITAAARQESLPRTPLPWNADYIAKMTARFILNLARQGQLLKSFLIGFMALELELPYATGCTGTDCSALGMVALNQALCDLGVSAHIGQCSFQNLACAESDVKKHGFMEQIQMLASSKAQQLFEDINDLSDDNASDLYQKMPFTGCAKLFIAGFSCIVLSRLNIHHSSDKSRDCINTGYGQTGRTFQGVRSFLHKFRDKTLGSILENVVALRDKDEQTGLIVLCIPWGRDSLLMVPMVI